MSGQESKWCRPVSGYHSIQIKLESETCERRCQLGRHEQGLLSHNSPRDSGEIYGGHQAGSTKSQIEGKITSKLQPELCGAAEKTGERRIRFVD